MKKYFKLEIIVAALAAVALAGFLVYIFWPKKDTGQVPQTTMPQQQENTKPEEPKKTISSPIANAKNRITKKPFGVYITPASSPVSGEKFTGYHTGTDFETTPEEASQDIPIYATCTGKIRTKEIVSGYGGVIVQDCTIDSQQVTVLYGHLNIRQAQVLGVGAEAKGGEKIGILAQSGSELSGGERKHLHLGIHKGVNIDYRGYVQNQSELSEWQDVQKLL
ncbi:M23 family metallopeptidase [Patescibacteria group bacterium]|nr:M23 family metallopeptidase [Patescibacteria group bacterium]